MRRLIAGCICGLAFCALIAPTPAVSARAPNVVGRLVRAPAANCYPDEPCDPASVGAMLVFAHNGTVIRRIRVGAGGRFALWLAPGVYQVRALPPPEHGQLVPSAFRVPATGSVSLRLRIR
jgi:hypothetical protein